MPFYATKKKSPFGSQNSFKQSINILQKSSRAKIDILACRMHVQTLDKVSEIRAHYLVYFE